MDKPGKFSWGVFVLIFVVLVGAPYYYSRDNVSQVNESVKEIKDTIKEFHPPQQHEGVASNEEDDSD